MSFKIGFTDVLPTGSGTTTLFNSVTAFGAGSMDGNGMKRLAVSIYHDQSGTLRASWSRNGGTTWRTFYNEVKTAPGANAITGPVDFLLDTFSDVKVEWINGGVDQTVFEVEMRGLESRLVAA